MFKSGYVGIIGSPNAGKSTLLNELLDSKVVITSNKVGTTRNAIYGIHTDDQKQIVFVDTPGINTPQNKLQVYMKNQAEFTIQNVNIVVYLLDAEIGLKKREEEIISKISQNKEAIKIACVNKIDKIEQEKAIELINKLNDKKIFNEVLAFSLKDGINTESILNLIGDYLEEGELIYEKDQVVDFTENFYIQEIVREKVLNNTYNEVPHSVYVKVKQKEFKKDSAYIEAVIYVERESQKGIVIGAKASMIKQIGQYAREDLEKYFGKKVYLDLIVRVDKRWTNKEDDFFEQD